VVLGTLLLLPTFVFVVASALRFESGWLYNSTFGAWFGKVFILDAFMNVALPLAPFLALVLLTKPSVQAHVHREAQSLSTPVAGPVGKVVLAMASICLFVLLSMSAHFVMEDGPCWMGNVWC
jgi:hypothetical protein